MEPRKDKKFNLAYLEMTKKEKQEFFILSNNGIND